MSFPLTYRVTKPFANGPLSLWLHKAYASWQRRKTKAYLSALDDRILQDIGIVQKGRKI